MALSPPVAIHGLFCFPAGFFGAFVLAAVPLFFALCQGDFALCEAIAKVDSQGNDGQAFGLSAAGKLVNFILMEQELTGAERLVIPGATRQVLCNVRVHKPSTIGPKIDVSVANIRLSFAQGRYFCTVENQPRLMFLEDKVVVGSGAVLRHDLFARLLGFLLGFLGWLGHGFPSYIGTALNLSRRGCSMQDSQPYPACLASNSMLDCP